MYGDKLGQVLTMGHYTSRPLTVERIGTLDRAAMVSFYRERFANAADFSFFMVGAFAVCHGHAHGTELPAGQSGLLYSMGFVSATGCLHGLGIALGLLHRWPIGKLALRGAGALIAVMGVLFLWRALT